MVHLAPVLVPRIESERHGARAVDDGLQIEVAQNFGGIAGVEAPDDDVVRAHFLVEGELEGGGRGPDHRDQFLRVGVAAGKDEFVLRGGDGFVRFFQRGQHPVENGAGEFRHEVQLHFAAGPRRSGHDPAVGVFDLDGELRPGTRSLHRDFDGHGLTKGNLLPLGELDVDGEGVGGQKPDPRGVDIFPVGGQFQVGRKLVPEVPRRGQGDLVVARLEFDRDLPLRYDLPEKVFITVFQLEFHVTCGPDVQQTLVISRHDGRELHPGKVAQSLGHGQVFELPVGELPAGIIVVDVPQSRGRNRRVVDPVVDACVHDAAAEILPVVELNHLGEGALAHVPHPGHQEELRRERGGFAQEFRRDIFAVEEEQMGVPGPFAEEVQEGGFHILFEVHFRDPDHIAFRGLLEPFDGVGFKFWQHRGGVDAHDAAAVDEGNFGEQGDHGVFQRHALKQLHDDPPFEGGVLALDVGQEEDLRQSEGCRGKPFFVRRHHRVGVAFDQMQRLVPGARELVPQAVDEFHAFRRIGLGNELDVVGRDGLSFEAVHHDAETAEGRLGGRVEGDFELLPVVAALFRLVEYDARFGDGLAGGVAEADAPLADGVNQIVVADPDGKGVFAVGFGDEVLVKLRPAGLLRRTAEPDATLSHGVHLLEPVVTGVHPARGQPLGVEFGKIAVAEKIGFLQFRNVELFPRRPVEADLDLVVGEVDEIAVFIPVDSRFRIQPGQQEVGLEPGDGEAQEIFAVAFFHREGHFAGVVGPVVGDFVDSEFGKIGVGGEERFADRVVELTGNGQVDGALGDLHRVAAAHLEPARALARGVELGQNGLRARFFDFGKGLFRGGRRHGGDLFARGDFYREGIGFPRRQGKFTGDELHGGLGLGKGRPAVEGIGFPDRELHHHPFFAFHAPDCRIGAEGDGTPIIPLGVAGVGKAMDTALIEEVFRSALLIIAEKGPDPQGRRAGSRVQIFEGVLDEEERLVAVERVGFGDPQPVEGPRAPGGKPDDLGVPVVADEFGSEFEIVEKFLEHRRFAPPFRIGHHPFREGNARPVEKMPLPDQTGNAAAFRFQRGFEGFAVEGDLDRRQRERENAQEEKNFPHDGVPPWSEYLRIGGVKIGPVRSGQLVHGLAPGAHIHEKAVRAAVVAEVRGAAADGRRAQERPGVAGKGGVQRPAPRVVGKDVLAGIPEFDQMLHVPVGSPAVTAVLVADVAFHMPRTAVGPVAAVGLLRIDGVRRTLHDVPRFGTPLEGVLVVHHRQSRPLHHAPAPGRGRKRLAGGLSRLEPGILPRGRRQETLEGVHVEGDGHPLLLDVVEAFGAASPFPGLLQRGQEHGGEDGDDGDDDEQFDQGEGAFFHCLFLFVC